MPFYENCHLYYDYDKRYKNEFGDYVENYGETPDDEKLERQVKCVYTKNLRLEKLFGYLLIAFFHYFSVAY